MDAELSRIATAIEANTSAIVELCKLLGGKTPVSSPKHSEATAEEPKAEKKAEPKAEKKAEPKAEKKAEKKAEPKTEETEAKAVDAVAIRELGKQLMAKGKTVVLTDALKEVGASKISELKPEDFQAVYDALSAALSESTDSALE